MFITALCIILLVAMVLGYAFASRDTGEEFSQPVWIFTSALLPMATAFMSFGSTNSHATPVALAFGVIDISICLLAVATLGWWLFWKAFLALGTTRNKT